MVLVDDCELELYYFRFSLSRLVNIELELKQEVIWRGCEHPILSIELLMCCAHLNAEPRQFVLWHVEEQKSYRLISVQQEIVQDIYVDNCVLLQITIYIILLANSVIRCNTLHPVMGA